MLSKTISILINTLRNLKNWVDLGTRDTVLPLKDTFFPLTVFVLIIVNVVVFPGNKSTFSFPALWSNPIALVSYQFAHGNIEHLMGNMLLLLLAGPLVEQHLGVIKFIALYLVSGAISALGYGIFYPNSELVGASGAISGVLAVYPFVQSSLAGVLISGVLLGFHFLHNFMTSVVTFLVPTGVATLAHVAGGVTGILMFCLYKRK